MPEQLPFIPGHEGAGVVSSVGSQVSGVTVGDRVGWAWPGVLGGYAERVAVPAQWIVPLPPQIGPSTAAAALIQGLTAHYLSHAVYPVRPGETVLVHAAAGGVGSLLTRMVKLRGGRVIGTVSTAAKEKYARLAGADEVIRYTEVDFAAEVARLTRGAGIAAVFDNVGPCRPDVRADRRGVAHLLKALASYVGQTACITPDLEKIIGRPATSYAQWAVQPADAYR